MYSFLRKSVVRMIEYTIILIFLFTISIHSVIAYTEYKVGDEVTYNNVDYYVIKNSGANEKEVTMLKAEPLSYEEVQTYSTGTGINIYNQNGYGGMKYHSSSNNYKISFIKTTVDAWAQAKVPQAIEARLITYDDLITNLGYVLDESLITSYIYIPSLKTPSWVYNSSYWYWTMTPYNDSMSYVWRMNADGLLESHDVGYAPAYAVRPVVTLSKTALGDVEEFVDSQDKEIDYSIDNETKTNVNVDNTYMSTSILVIILGLLIASISIFVLYKISNNKKE